MKKVWVFLTLGILIISLAFAVGIGKGHKSAQIDFKLSGADKSLDNAFENNGNGNFNLAYFNMAAPDKIIFGHKPSEIYVNVNGVVKNFSLALSDGSLKNTPANKSPSNYPTQIIFGETANNVVLNEASGRTLQDAINEGAFFAGCYDGATLRLSGSTWQVPYTTSYECNCGKSGCETCYGTAYATKTCLNRVIS